MSSEVRSVDARSGESRPTGVRETSPVEVALLTTRAAGAAGWLADADRTTRAALLDAVAAELDHDAGAIIEAADRETALGTIRLEVELARTSYQLRFFGEVVRDGGYLDVVIDHADPAALPAPRPDLRRMLVPLGPVAVFGASNFPLAFSVPGGDTASALAAGCPVVVKAHPGHPVTSELAGAAINRALADAGAPAGTFSLVYGEEAGLALVRDREVRAVGFTGSLRGGRALFDEATSRADPIPFYGELGSLNPLVVTRAAAGVRSDDIGGGSAASVLLGMGQFCTKPGLLFVPTGRAGDSVVKTFLGTLAAAAPGHLLTARTRTALVAGTADVLGTPGVQVLHRASGEGDAVGPVAVQITAERLIAEDAGPLLDEHFGPFAVIVRYLDDIDLRAALLAVPASLTATVQGAGEADPQLGPLIELLSGQSGRVVVDGYPTGVAVSWAMQHGGPYPASTAADHTSVGAAAIRRWLRPVTYQGVPQSLLPAELQDSGVPGLSRRVNGRLDVVRGS